MTYINVEQAAKKWGISPRSVRKYCEDGRVAGAKNISNIWHIPAEANKPTRLNESSLDRSLLSALRFENQRNLHGGIYHKIQIELTYNSNHIEGSRLTHEQTRYIFETNTIGAIKSFGSVNTDDIIETANHFRCVDYIIDNANRQISEHMIKRLHFILKNGTSDARKEWFVVGAYKKFPNEVGGKETTPPKDVPKEMRKLIEKYRKKVQLSFNDLLNFHYEFERIHPFQDGNGRVGRLILFKECLRLGITPFIIDDELKLYYYRGLHEWKHEPGYLKETCGAAQDKFAKYLDYFDIEYSK